MLQLIETAALKPPGHSGGVTEVSPWKNVIVLKHFPWGAGPVMLLPICWKFGARLDLDRTCVIEVSAFLYMG